MIRLSKSRFTLGVQCHRALWWKVHEPDAAELASDPAQQSIFDQGTRVGDLARTYVPGGELIDVPFGDADGRIENTRAALADGARVLYEASFRADDVFVSVDILHRAPRARGWTLTEVKSTTKVKPAHVPDAAVQTHVLRRAGLPIVKTEVMHLDRACRHPDLTNLFARTDVSDDVEAYLPRVPSEVKRQLRVLERASPPDVEPGDHCRAPYPCPFFDRCWDEAPSSSGEVVVRHGLRDALAVLKAPIAHLDFETIAPAIPAWPACRPYDPVPVQFSVHVEPGIHHEWLAEGPGDPRPELARALVRALRGARSIVVYHQPFEEARLRELAAAVPESAAAIDRIIERLVDLLPIVRAYVKHPGFGGRFGLKHVAPVLVPGLRYDELEVADGGAASRALEAMLLGPSVSEEETRKTRAALLAYCGQDTKATMGVLDWLRRAG